MIDTSPEHIRNTAALFNASYGIGLPHHVTELMCAAADRISELEAALAQLRDCDWVITLPDRMDAVREIARKALGNDKNG